MTTHYMTEFNGQTATRTTKARTYTNAVWIWRTDAWLEDRIAKLPAVGTNEHTATNGRGEKFYTLWTPEYRARIEAQLRKDHVRNTVPGVAGWQGRPDLAVKFAATLANQGWMVAITDAVEVEKGFKPVQPRNLLLY